MSCGEDGLHRRPEPLKEVVERVLAGEGWEPESEERLDLGTLSSVEVCAAAGCSYRQLDYWIRLGWIPGEPRTVGSGVQRRFTEAQRDLVCRLAEAARMKHLSLPELAERLGAR